MVVKREPENFHSFHNYHQMANHLSLHSHLNKNGHVHVFFHLYRHSSNHLVLLARQEDMEVLVEGMMRQNAPYQKYLLLAL